MHKIRGIAAARQIWWQEGAWFDVMRRRPIECRAADQRRIIDDFGGQPWLDAGLISRSSMIIEESLAALETPLLIVNGEFDLPDFLKVADDLEALMLHAQKVAIPEAGGFSLWEFLDRVNAIVREFFSRH